jgi:hypothetical protein
VRDIAIGYIIAMCIYALIGIFGSIALVVHKPTVSNPATILQYFSDHDIVPLFVEIFFSLKLITVYPLIFILGKL